MDVTKGCEIVVSVQGHKFQTLNLNQIYQKPHIFTHKTNSIKIYAGVGVGVVTKMGLKISPNYPAINPVPLTALKNCFEKFIKDRKNLHLYCKVSVTDGEQIAKQTANSKVGVLGGISILGTKGFVKPVSATAYLDSIKTEINFAMENGFKTLVFTIGNSSFQKASKSYKKEQIIEIGNFVYDSINFRWGTLSLVLICGIGKLTKISQGFKNTHNRFGSIDFKAVEKATDKNLDGVISMKRVCEMVGREKVEKIMIQKAKKQLKNWFDKNIEIIIV